MGKVYNSIDELVGNTPIICLHKIMQKYEVAANIMAKCEFFNPLFSVKDRVALNMINKVPFSHINKNTVFIEATSGNTGIALAAFCAARGYKLIIVLAGTLNKGAEVLTHVLSERREEIAKNHSSTHLLQKTLQDLLGDKVHQAGSRVDDKSFRFDFTYHGRLNDEIMSKLEVDVNKRVDAGYETKIEYLYI